jgi:hypothetical protein
LKVLPPLNISRLVTNFLPTNSGGHVQAIAYIYLRYEWQSCSMFPHSILLPPFLATTMAELLMLSIIQTPWEFYSLLPSLTHVSSISCTCSLGFPRYQWTIWLGIYTLFNCSLHYCISLLMCFLKNPRKAISTIFSIPLMIIIIFSIKY